MAKSARASSKKAARSRIRNTVYAPVEQARLERLSARLMASISQPAAARPNNGDRMEEDDIDDTTNHQEQHTEDQAFKTAQQDSKTTNMDVDESTTKSKSASSSYKISKQRKRKSNTKSIVFNTRKNAKGGKATKGSKSRK